VLLSILFVEITKLECVQIPNNREIADSQSEYLAVKISKFYDASGEMQR
jgi:hypothetical protein